MINDKNINMTRNDNHEINMRKKKLSNMKKTGFSFPNNFKKNITLKQIYQEFQKIRPS